MSRLCENHQTLQTILRIGIDLRCLILVVKLSRFFMNYLSESLEVHFLN
jgi:uncharacterized membrane protein YwzB